MKRSGGISVKRPVKRSDRGFSDETSEEVWWDFSEETSEEG